VPKRSERVTSCLGWLVCFATHGPAEDRGAGGQYAGAALHAGLICLNGPAKGMDLDLTPGRFWLRWTNSTDADLVNQVLEITAVDAYFDVLRYALPPY